MRRAYGPEAKPISKEEGNALAKQIKAYAYFETSAKENIGVAEAMNADEAHLHLLVSSLRKHHGITPIHNVIM